MSEFATIPQAIKEIKKGCMLILVDHPDRENEGDFYVPADVITPAHIMTMIRMGGGLVCTAITAQQQQQLQLPLMVEAYKNAEKTGVQFTISVDAASGISTGISVHDRVQTIKTLANPNSEPKSLVTPGHVFGLVAREGGVKQRPGHTEAAVDLAKFAGFNSAGVLCEIVGKDGHMAKLPELQKIAERLRIKLVSIDDLIHFQ